MTSLTCGSRRGRCCHRSAKAQISNAAAEDFRDLHCILRLSLLQLIKRDVQTPAVVVSHSFLHEKPAVLIVPWKAVTKDDQRIGITNGL
jgi:hypothetical protein